MRSRRRSSGTASATSPVARGCSWRGCARGSSSAKLLAAPRVLRLRPGAAGPRRASEARRRQRARSRRPWTRGDERSSHPRSRSRSPRRSKGEGRERRSKGTFESNHDELDTAQRRRGRAHAGRRGRSSSGSSAGGRHRPPSVFRGASSSTGKSIHERFMAWSEEYPGRLAARPL